MELKPRPLSRVMSSWCWCLRECSEAAAGSRRNGKMEPTATVGTNPHCQGENLSLW